MANMTRFGTSRRTITNLSEQQQIAELNRQLDWIWNKLLGGIDEKSLSKLNSILFCDAENVGFHNGVSGGIMGRTIDGIVITDHEMNPFAVISKDQSFIPLLECNSLHAYNGATGTFTTADNKTVTVTDGIITDIS